MGDINMNGVILGTELAIDAMRKSKQGGIIINTASMGGIFPMDYNPVYAASKAGVIHFSRSLASLASEGIHVCAICPTYTITPLTAAGDVERMKQELGGKILTADKVAQGFVTLVEDPRRAGKVMRVTVAKGLDYWEPKAQIEQISSRL